VPAPTPLAENVVAVLPVLKFARFESPVADPASITKPVGAQPPAGAVQEIVTDDPVAEPVRPVGAPGAVTQALPPTTMTVSFEASLVPALLRALTRTKYVAAGTLVAVNVTAVLNVSNTMMLLAPAVDPASMTYDAGASPPAGAVQNS
jgi:hypothetical protein